MTLWVWFLFGLVVGGSLSASALAVLSGLLAWLPKPVSAVVGMGLVLAVVCYDLRVDRVELPQRRALIPQEVFFRSRAWGFWQFGVEFGSGVRTFITSTSIYVLALTILFLHVPPLIAIAVGTAFGVGRSIAPLQAVFADERWSDSLVVVSRRLERSGAVVVAIVAVVTASKLLAS